MSEMSMNMGKITLKELLKYDVRYLRICPRDNKIVAHTNQVPIKVGKQTAYKELWFEVDMPIYLGIRDSGEGLEKAIPSYINLHGSDADTLFTLLQLMPYELSVNYYHNGMSQEWTQKHHLCMEHINISGRVKTGKDKVTEFKVAIQNNYENSTTKLAMWR